MTLLASAIRRTTTGPPITHRIPNRFHAIRLHVVENLSPRGLNACTEAVRLRADARTTMVYTQILDRGPMGVVSPLDR